MAIICEIIRGAINGGVNPVKRRIIEKRSRSKLIEMGEKRNLYQTMHGNKFWLNKDNYLDQQIIKNGIWEAESTAVVEKVIKKGWVTLDIGANIGYYTILMSKAVGATGRVIAFEPTHFFGDILEKNLNANNVTNCLIKHFALSESQGQTEIFLGDDTATMHMVSSESDKHGKEIIEIRTLDDVVSELKLDRIDFIKIDVDGHEPAVIKGGMNTIKKFKPVVLLEVSHLSYLEYGMTAWDFYDYLKDNSMHIYYEDDLKECTSKLEFLQRCANFNYSSNIIISEKELDI